MKTNKHPKRKINPMYSKIHLFLLLLFSGAYAIGQPNDIILPTKTIAVGTTDNYEAVRTITCPSGTAFIVEGNCTLNAGEEILLEDGFEAKNGSEFCAIIEMPLLAYATMKPALDASFYRCQGGYLKLKVEEDYAHANDVLNIKFYDKTNTLTYQPSTLLKSTGVNRYSLNLASTGLFTNDDYYTVVVEDLKKRKTYLRIQYHD